ncbi:hypothetical protein MY494_07370 [Synechococcus sp. A10-1-5-1]|uniref:hypothetical protein n=1 Tax=Synechococcus sp. A10-1-5-1 TaxID=2936507 RepID=UPI002001D82D|nr:hypothetical protein [Synechococcus sp. A10-1-5-1]UPM49173.1 hypothetical protein MY494_07370 [Synechococcus sp. A10-1-5-1]
MTMGSKRRRLKRYLGLKHDGDGGHQGGIEHLLPGRLSGWVFGASEPFHEVRLLVGAHLIARAEVDQSRPDVCEQLGREGTPGFSLALPAELPPLDWSQPARLLALSADGRHQADLRLIGKKADTSVELSQLLQSDALGLEGHFDGLVGGQLQGWAARRGQAKPAQIWLQAVGREPISIECQQWREGMAERCGFQLSLSTLPASWSGSELWCSFDPAGMYRLPQEQEVVVPERAASTQLMPMGAASHNEQMQNAPKHLQSHWQALEDFRLFLDGLEQELNRRDGIRSQQTQAKPLRAGWVGRLLRPAR